MEHIDRPPVEIKSVVIEPGARFKLPEILSSLNSVSTVAVLMDDRVYHLRNGEELKPSVLAGLHSKFTVVTVILQGEVHADEITVEKAVTGAEQADAVVTIGSGTLCDIGKVVAGSRPHIVVQTAASVNGFADDQSVLLIKGTKRTTHSTWPHTILIDNDVLAAAPTELNRSGLGDMISMFTAPADWYLASIFGLGNGFNYSYATMTRRYGENLLSIAEGVGKSETGALTTLAEFVTLSGISMGVAGQTSPSSGMEHTVSHLIDMSNGAQNLPNAFHGEQVGITTILVSLLWNRMVRKLESNDLGLFHIPSESESRKQVWDAFEWMDSAGETASECWSDYSKKRDFLLANKASEKLADLNKNWPQIHQQLDTLLIDPEKVINALQNAGAPTRFRDLSNPVSAHTVFWAMKNCHLMRNRFTIADLAFFTGNWSDEDINDLLSEASSLGAAF